MTENNDQRPPADDDQAQDSQDRDSASRPARQEPVFSGFDLEEDTFDEPERDTDQGSAYFDDSVEDGLDDDQDDYLDDEPEADEEALDNLLGDQDTPDEVDPGDFLNGAEQADEDELEDYLVDTAQPDEEERPADKPPELPLWQQAPLTAMGKSPAADEIDDGDDYDGEDYDGEDDAEEDWQEDDDYASADDDGPYEDDTEAAQHFPPALIFVAVVALLLLAAGGYGVMQQRAETGEEIRRLEAELATTANPAEVKVMREELRESTARNATLQEEVQALRLDKRRLDDTVAGLESQLEAQQQALAKQAAAPKPLVAPQPAAPKPAAPKPAPAKPAAVAASSGDWFVNFGSYTQRDVAQSWAAKLKPGAGKVAISEFKKGGTMYYRVRVVSLPNKESAQKVASQLAVDHGVKRTWVGQQ